MNYFFDVSIPANTLKTAPVTEILKLTAGVITHIQIRIPSGHAGLAHLQIFYHDAQLYPLSRGEDYHGDDMEIGFEEYQPVIVSPCDLKAVGWNEDDTYEHAFLISITMMRPEEMGREIPGTSLAALNSLLEGANIELGEGSE